MDKGTQEKVDASLFSSEERRNLVRSFIAAYIGGAARINFVSPGELGVSGHTYTAEEGTQQRAVFRKLIDVATGATKATAAEVHLTIDQLFSTIVAARQGGRIEGEFLQGPNVESRLESLEGRLADIERLLEELQNLIRIRGQRQ